MIDFDSLRSKNDIAALIAQTVALKKAGSNLMGLCPFHSEKTPSFSVNPITQRFHCFGCHAHGDVVDFVMQYQNLTTAEAVKSLGGQIDFSKNVRKDKPAERPRSRRRGRPEIPELSVPTNFDLRSISQMRSIPVEALERAAAAECLWISEYWDRKCWMITDRARVNCQARRVDGMPFKDRKAMTLPQSWARWPIGIANIPDSAERIIVCEGGPDFLAAFHAITDDTSYPVAMVGASMDIHPAALPYFHHRKVAILPHRDAPGAAAAIRWAEQLKFLDVEIMELPDDDLNDCIKSDPDFCIL